MTQERTAISRAVLMTMFTAFAAALLLSIVSNTTAARSDVEMDPAVVPEDVRNAGDNRYETAAVTALAAFDADDVDDVLLATGEGFADALSGAALAGAVEGPVLLTAGDTLPGATSDALATLDPSTVHLLGGQAAISTSVAEEVAALGFDVNRIGGQDRYATAAAVADTIVSDEVGGQIGEVDGQRTVLLASGVNFADAVAAGPGAYAGTHPILLTRPESLPTATTDALATLGVDRVVVLGGTAAVSSDVQDELAQDFDVLRVAGEDRFDTAAALARFFIDNLAFDPSNVGLANGRDGFGGADALASAPYLGAADAPLLLTASLPEASRDLLAEFAAEVDTLHVFGGEVAVDAATVSAAQTAVAQPTYTVELSWINEVTTEGDEPTFFAGIPDGTGQAELTMNRAAGTIDYRITTDIADRFDDAPGAHLHAGPFDDNGPIVVFFATGPELDAGNGQIEGTVSEDDFEEDFADTTVEDIVGDLENYYPNIHSNTFPMPGAVRGQLPFGGQDLITARNATFEVELSAAHEVVEGGFGVDSDAEGTATLTFRPDSDAIDFEVSVDLPQDDGFADGPGAHLHTGRIDENGPIVVFFATGQELEDNDGNVSGTLTTDDFLEDYAGLSVADILRDAANYYVNVHSDNFPMPGVARGQLPDGGGERIERLKDDDDDDNGGGLY